MGDITAAQATKDKDKAWILNKFEEIFGDVKRANKILGTALDSIRKASVASEKNAFTLTTAGIIAGAAGIKGIKIPRSLIFLEAGKIKQWLLCGIGCAACKCIMPGIGCVFFNKLGASLETYDNSCFSCYSG